MTDQHYPYPDGDFTVLGPGIFASSDGKTISWRGENYERQEAKTSDAETTTRVFAALHRSAEETVTRVIDLHERWVKAGPPPLGTSINRWWDKRLAEFHRAIQPPAGQSKEQP